MNFFCCKNLSKRYHDQIVFENVNIVFPSFGLVSIVGRSGSGKSTLINCLLGLEKSNQGEIYFNGNKIIDFDDFRNKNCGVIFQNFHLFDYLSVKENILLFGKSKLYGKLVRQLSLEKLLDKKVGLLSSGEKQRVAIARTLMKEPKIIFCDEITGSLDQENAIRVMEYLKVLSEEILIINISHNLDLVNQFSTYLISLDRLNVDFVCLKEEVVKVNANKYNLKLFNLIKLSFQLLNKSLLQIALSVIGLIISLSVFSMVNNINEGVHDYLNDSYRLSLDYTFLELSVVNETKIENTSFVLTKHTRPNDWELEDISYLLDGVKLRTNYSNLINSYTELTSSNVDLNLSFIPCESNLFTSHNQLIVNESANQLIKDNLIYKLNNSISFIGDNNEVISDVISLEINFEVIGINYENVIFQQPIVYYSYSYFEDYLYTIQLDNLSSFYNKNLTLGHRITYYSYEGDFYNTGSIYLVLDEDRVMEVYEQINSRKSLINFGCQSRSIESFLDLSNLFVSVEKAINIFIFISIIISICVFFISFSSILINEKKDLVVLQSLGINKSQISKLTFIQIDILLLLVFLLTYMFIYIFFFVIDYIFPFLSLSDISRIFKQSYLIFTLLYIMSFIFKLGSLLIRRKVVLIDVLKEN